MVRDEILRALGDPREIANAQLVGVRQGDGDGQSSRIRDGLSSSSGLACDCRLEALAAESFGYGQVEAEKLAAIVVGHNDILMGVDVSAWRNPTRSRHDDDLSPVT